MADFIPITPDLLCNHMAIISGPSVRPKMTVQLLAQDLTQVPEELFDDFDLTFFLLPLVLLLLAPVSITNQFRKGLSLEILSISQSLGKQRLQLSCLFILTLRGVRVVVNPLRSAHPLFRWRNDEHGVGTKNERRSGGHWARTGETR
jgi:hypothetical protein